MGLRVRPRTTPPAPLPLPIPHLTLFFLPAARSTPALNPAAALAAAVLAATPAYADQNKFEAEQRGEFGIGSAAQYDSAVLKYARSSVYSSSSYFIGLLIFSLSRVIL
jgi:hypothetical protein